MPKFKWTSDYFYPTAVPLVHEAGLDQNTFETSTNLNIINFYSVEIVSEEQPSANSWRKMGQNQNDNRHTQGQGQSETTDKLGKGQSDTAKQVNQSQSQIMEKLVEDEEIFAVFEEQEERLLRMEISCENLLQKQVHSQSHKLVPFTPSEVESESENFFDV